MNKPWLVVLLVVLIYVSVIGLVNGDAQAFVTLGSCFTVCNSNDGENCPVPDDASAAEQLEIEGYDGQFNYFIARDPANAAPCIDVPAYRYQRILLPISGWVISVGGIEDIIPFAFLFINILALVASTRLLEDLLVLENKSRWFALSYGLFFGLVVSVRLSTAEPLAYGLVVAAIWAYRKNHLWLMTLALALAGFTKETTGIMTAGFLLWFVLQKRWSDAVRLVLVEGVPFLIWQGVLLGWLGEPGLGSGGAKATGFEIIPFGGVFRILTEGSLPAFLIIGGLLLFPPVILPTLWGLRASWFDFRRQNVTLYTCLLLAAVAIMPFVPFSTYREYLGIYRFIPGLVLMVVLYSAERDLRRPLLYSTLYIVLLLFLSAG